VPRWHGDRLHAWPFQNRDLGVAYLLVVATYTFVAATFYAAFPLSKDCIADVRRGAGIGRCAALHAALFQNLLNNFGTGDLLSCVARVFLLFQMLTVYPLLAYLIRVQLLCRFYAEAYPRYRQAWPVPSVSRLSERSLWHVAGLNLGVCCCGILFAVLFPSVGAILRCVALSAQVSGTSTVHPFRFVGSVSGLVYVFALPCMVHMKRLKAEGKLTVQAVAIHYSIMFVGLANFLAQFALLI